MNATPRQALTRIRTERGFRAGLVAGVLPQALLLLYLINRLITFADDPEERAYFVLLVLANVAVLPVCYVVAVLCLIFGGVVRSFGVGLFIGSTVAAAVFTAICLAATPP